MIHMYVALGLWRYSVSGHSSSEGILLIGPQFKRIHRVLLHLIDPSGGAIALMDPDFPSPKGVFVRGML